MNISILEDHLPHIANLIKNRQPYRLTELEKWFIGELIDSGKISFSESEEIINLGLSPRLSGGDIIDSGNNVNTALYKTKW